MQPSRAFAATDMSGPLFAQEQRIGVEEYEALCKGTRNLTPPPITDELSRWVNETQWSALQPLTQLPVGAPNTTAHACIGSVYWYCLAIATSGLLPWYVLQVNPQSSSSS